MSDNRPNWIDRHLSSVEEQIFMFRNTPSPSWESTGRRRLDWNLWLAVGATLAALVTAFILGAMPWPGETEAERVCDQAVQTVLTSRDPIELQRAGILIQGLDCGVRRRLPRDG